MDRCFNKIISYFFWQFFIIIATISINNSIIIFLSWKKNLFDRIFKILLIFLITWIIHKVLLGISGVNIIIS